MATLRKLTNFDVSQNDADLLAVPPQINLTPSSQSAYIGIDSVGSFWINGTKVTGASPFSRGGTLTSPQAATIVVWDAPFACTVTNVRGWVDGSTGSVINAQHNGSTLLASNLTLSSADTWLDGGAVQNTAFVTGDTLAIQIVSVSGTPNYISIQVNFTRP